MGHEEHPTMRAKMGQGIPIALAPPPPFVGVFFPFLSLSLFFGLAWLSYFIPLFYCPPAASLFVFLQ